MPCESKTVVGQTLTQRKQEVRETIIKLSALLASGKVKPVIGKQGAIAFDGWLDVDRNRVTDSCAYRMTMVSGSPLAKMAIAKAEQMAGRTVDKQVIGQGVHSHDSGKSWHGGHK